MMTPHEFWLKASGWGSFMTSGDPGACMYGFNERGEVRSEQHRKQCIAWLAGECREAAKCNDDPEADNKEIDDLIAYLRTAPLEKLAA